MYSEFSENIPLLMLALFQAESIEVRTIDNTQVRKIQIEKLNKVKSSRDNGKVLLLRPLTELICFSGTSLLGRFD